MAISGLDLFSGIGGITLALSEWVRPIAYCEIDKYAQAVLISRMSDGLLPAAPICTDVRKLDGRAFRGLVDIIYGGFPCQDLSVAGLGKAWKRSARAYSSRSCGWPKKSDQNSFSLKTSRRSVSEAWQLLGMNWPQQGLIVAGRLYPLLKSERHISGNGGFYWPTPTASETDKHSWRSPGWKAGVLFLSGGV